MPTIHEPSWAEAALPFSNSPHGPSGLQPDLTRSTQNCSAFFPASELKAALELSSDRNCPPACHSDTWKFHVTPSPSVPGWVNSSKPGLPVLALIVEHALFSCSQVWGGLAGSRP